MRLKVVFLILIVFKIYKYNSNPVGKQVRSIPKRDARGSKGTEIAIAKPEGAKQSGSPAGQAGRGTRRLIRLVI